MPRYAFVSPGAMAQMSIEDVLLQRAMEERQALLDERAAAEQHAQAGHRAEQLKLQQAQEARVTEAQQRQQADLEKERRFRRASTIATTGVPGVVDVDTAGLLREEGYGSLISQGQPTQGDDDGGAVPGVLHFSGGTNFQNARAAEAARATEAEHNRAAAAERADADRQTRELIAGMSNTGRTETAGLRNDLLRTQIDAAKDKQETARATDERARQAARQTAGATLDVLNELATFNPDGSVELKAGTGNLFGLRNPAAQYWPGSDTANAAAALERLKGRVVVDLIGEMKSQSRTGATGFGALSEPELLLLQNAATKLNSPNISNTSAAAELGRIYSIAQRAMGDDAGASYQVGQTVTVDGRPAVVTGIDPSGKPRVRFQ